MAEKKQKFQLHAYGTKIERDRVMKFLEDIQDIGSGHIRSGDALTAIILTVQENSDYIAAVRRYIRNGN